MALGDSNTAGVRLLEYLNIIELNNFRGTCTIQGKNLLFSGFTLCVTFDFIHNSFVKMLEKSTVL